METSERNTQPVPSARSSALEKKALGIKLPAHSIIALTSADIHDALAQELEARSAQKSGHITSESVSDTTKSQSGGAERVQRPQQKCIAAKSASSRSRLRSSAKVICTTCGRGTSNRGRSVFNVDKGKATACDVERYSQGTTFSPKLGITLSRDRKIPRKCLNWNAIVIRWAPLFWTSH